MTHKSKSSEVDLFKGLVAGVAGGLLASLVMEQFQALWTKVGKKVQEAEGEKPRPSRAKATTVKAADAISKKITGHKVPKDKQTLAGEAVHYAMGTTSAAIYGTLAEFAPLVTVGEGLAFGTAVWLVADEASLPALGLSKPPPKIPLSTHVYSFASHLVYGAVTEVVRRAVREQL
ncbi:MAG: DUF1440 domain-containing protein [Chthoniobacterales bacterium]